MSRIKTHAAYPGSEAKTITTALTTVDSSTVDLFVVPLTASFKYVFMITVVYVGIDVTDTSGFVIRTTHAWRDGAGDADQEGGVVVSSFGRVAGVTGSAQTVSVAVTGTNFRVTVDGRNDTDINWIGKLEYVAVNTAS